MCEPEEAAKYSRNPWWHMVVALALIVEVISLWLSPLTTLEESWILLILLPVLEFAIENKNQSSSALMINDSMPTRRSRCTLEVQVHTYFPLQVEVQTFKGEILAKKCAKKKIKIYVTIESCGKKHQRIIKIWPGGSVTWKVHVHVHTAMIIIPVPVGRLQWFTDLYSR